MASRRVYLTIATHLRGFSSVDLNEYPHTWLTRNLRMEVLESEHLLQARLAYAGAFAAVHGHPKADLEKAMSHTNQMYIHALDAIPYLTVGVNADVQAGPEAERMALIEAFKQAQAQHLKKDTGG